jgi:AAA15 family ATPase/GTPase
MLCQFTFENFKSFRDEVTLDFQATGISEQKDSLLISGSKHQKRFLPVTVIYGPNGGGKSGVLEALRSLITYVLWPVRMRDSGLGFIHWSLQDPIIRFKLDDESRRRPTKFEVFFRTSSAEYRYFLSLEHGRYSDGLDRGLTVCKESLHRRLLAGSNPAMLFLRDKDGIKTGSTVEVGSANINPKSTMPLLSFLYSFYEIDAVSEAVAWFKSCVFSSNLFITGLGLFFGGSAENSALKLHDVEDREEDISLLLKHMDLGVDGYQISSEESEFEGETYKNYSLNLQHRVQGKAYLLSETEESGGTQKILNLLPDLLVSLQEGRLLIADELDASLHPKLLEQIILLYKNPNINTGGGQLLFTSHDLSTMNNRLFRRDEIWFAAKDESESSVLYSLSEIKDEKGSSVRSDASYGKQYLSGRYGADPYFQRMLEWGNNGK